MPPNRPGPRLGGKLPCVAAKAFAKTLIERTTRSEGVRRQVTSRQSHVGGQLRKPGWQGEGLTPVLVHTGSLRVLLAGAGFPRSCWGNGPYAHPLFSSLLTPSILPPAPSKTLRPLPRVGRGMGPPNVTAGGSSEDTLEEQVVGNFRPTLLHVVCTKSCRAVMRGAFWGTVSPCMGNRTQRKGYEMRASGS